MLLDLFQPIKQVHEGLLTCHIISQEHTMGPTIEDSRHRFEGLLPGCIPNLKFEDLPSIDTEPERAEFHTYCDLVLNFELVVHDTLHET